MADYFSLLSRTIGSLPDNSLDQRKIVYERARLALLKQLRSIEPALPESEITHERLALEEAIRRVELDLVKAKAAGIAPKPSMPLPLPPLEEPEALFDDEAAIQAAVQEERVEMPTPIVETEKVELLEELPVVSSKAPLLKPALPSLPIISALQKNEEKPAIKVHMPVITEETGDADFEQKGSVHFDQPPEEKSNLGKAVLYTTIGFIIALLGLTALYFIFSSNNTVEPPVKQISQAAPPPIAPIQERKIDERIQQDAPVITQNTATTATTQAIAQNARAVLFEEAQSNSQSNTYFYGQVKWSAQPLKLGSQEQMIVGDVTIADKGITLQVLVKRNLDKVLPASHTIEIAVNSMEKGIKIANMPGVLLKNTEHVRGQAVVAQGVKITDTFYLIGLSANEADIARNTLLLKDWNYLDFPIEYDNRKRAILTLEKQMLGNKVFNDVFNSWGQ